MIHWYCKATYNLGQKEIQNGIQFGTEGVAYFKDKVILTPKNSSYDSPLSTNPNGDAIDSVITN